jgi:D-hexose-6-phosphate mutarotase
VLSKGAKVTSWKVKDSNGELQEIFYQGSEKRTGMPILFPWYRKNGDKRQHGFGRDVNWSIKDFGERQVTMGLNSENLDPESKAMYSYVFESKIKVEIDDKGDMTYSFLVKNNGTTNLPVIPGLHPNLAIDHEDKNKVKVEGMEGFDPESIDWTNNPPDNPYAFKGPVTVIMPGGKRIEISDVSPQGPQMKFWNTWADKNPSDKNFITPAEPLTGLDDAITRDPIWVAPGQTWNWVMKFAASITK